MSLLASFDLSTRALRAFQVAIQTISHNISNVNTPGYSRQRVIYSTENPILTGGSTWAAACRWKESNACATNF
jgi:flagellar hook-associated protein 1 FlgK